MASTERMTIALPAEMAQIVKAAVSSGDYMSNSEVFREALRSWTLQRKEYQQKTEEIIAKVNNGISDLEKGRTTSSEKLFSRLKGKYQDKGN